LPERLNIRLVQSFVEIVGAVEFVIVAVGNVIEFVPAHSSTATRETPLVGKFVLSKVKTVGLLVAMSLTSEPDANVTVQVPADTVPMDV
jgi:hypothetical protein